MPNFLKVAKNAKPLFKPENNFNKQVLKLLSLKVAKNVGISLGYFI
jgi:hypothetical protein